MTCANANGDGFVMTSTSFEAVYMRPPSRSKIYMVNDSVGYVVVGFMISAMLKLNSRSVKVSESKPPDTLRIVPKSEAESELDVSNSQLNSSLKPVSRVHVAATRSASSIVKLPGIPIFK